MLGSKKVLGELLNGSFIRKISKIRDNKRVVASAKLLLESQRVRCSRLAIFGPKSKWDKIQRREIERRMGEMLKV